LNAIEQGRDFSTPENTKVIQVWFDRFRDMENDLDDQIMEKIKIIFEEEPFSKRLMKVKGIGPIFVAYLITMIDIEKAKMVSALWRYAGFGVVDGKREKLVRGEKSHYNQSLKATVYKIGGSFLKCQSPYGEVYYQAKEYYEIKHPEWTLKHRHFASMGKMMKMFLAHLWLEWRKEKGLETRDLYVQEHLGHEHYRTAQEFGWPE
jgi:hypothetical protein